MLEHIGDAQAILLAHGQTHTQTHSHRHTSRAHRHTHTHNVTCTHVLDGSDLLPFNYLNYLNFFWGGARFFAFADCLKRFIQKKVP